MAVQADLRAMGHERRLASLGRVPCGHGRKG